MLIATSGHVDHGKTTLVHALTGVETDRLPDEKKRGVSIDLGFAYQSTASGQRIGYIDVPGHERFVRNMLAGVGAVDTVLLVVAADDGPMPQTREHLAILDLLGVDNGTVVLTRTDLVDATQLSEAAAACEALVDGTSLAGSPVLPVSAVTGDGMAALRARIAELADNNAQRDFSGRFRLSVDRQFSLAGTGLIVTGTVITGEVNAGDTVHLAPHGVSARIRSIRVNDEAATHARAGSRIALNLNATDLGRVTPQRGDWLTSDPQPQTSQRWDFRIDLLNSESRPLRHWTPVHVHHGTGSTTGRVALLEQRAVDPGTSGLAQLVLDQALHAVRGDRIILRDQSAKRTIGGGSILDPFGPAKGRARAERVALLKTIGQTPATNAFATLLQEMPGGVDLNWLAQTWNLSQSALDEQIADSPSIPVTLRYGHSLSKQVHLLPARWTALHQDLLTTLGQWHKAHPDQVGPTELQVRQALADRYDRGVIIAGIAHLVSAGEIVRQQARLHRAGHLPAQSAEQQRMWKKLRPHLAADITRPPVITDLAKKLDLTRPVLEKFLSDAAQRGELARFAANRYFHPAALATLADIARRLGEQHPDGFDARAYRDASGIGRNLTIEVLEFFDTRGLTRRIDDKRLVVGDSRELFGSPPTDTRKAR